MAALQGWEVDMEDWRAACKYDGTPSHNRWVQTRRQMFTGNQVTGTSGGLSVPNECTTILTGCTRSLVLVKDLQPVCAEGKGKTPVYSTHKVQFIICRRGMLPTLMLSSDPALHSLEC